MAVSSSVIEKIAAETFGVLDTGRQIAPFSTRVPNFALDDAYQVTRVVRHLREARGETPVGRKIGFTNRTTWPDYAPMWGYVYDRTTHDLAGMGGTYSLDGLAEPRIEPEIVIRLTAVPAPGMDERALLACVDGVAHGFEIVQSIFPDWVFSEADAVAAFGVHGALLVGPWHPVAGSEGAWLQPLATFDIDLLRNGVVVDHGRGANVLGGPLTALRHLVDLLARDAVNPPLAAGEIVTTGTLTRVPPVTLGEAWQTVLSGIALEGITVRLT